MHKNLINAGVKFPDFWDTDKVLKAFSTLESINLREYFGCNNSTSFTRLMKPCFPNRPEKSSYSKYIRELVSDDVLESVSKEITEDVLLSHLKDTPMQLKKFLKTLTEDQLARFNKLQHEDEVND